MIEGALKLNEKTVKDVMTQISYVFTVPEDGIVDYDFMSKITEAGYSRIPVTKPLNGDSIPQITGLLFLRDLVMVDPDDKIQVSTITSYYKHQLMKFDENTKELFTSYSLSPFTATTRDSACRMPREKDCNLNIIKVG